MPATYAELHAYLGEVLDRMGAEPTCVVNGESNVLVIDARASQDVSGKKGLRPAATGLHVSLLANGMKFDAAR